MPNQRQFGSNKGGSLRTGSSKGAVKVNRPLTSQEKQQNKAAETYKTKTSVKNPNKVEQGKKIMAGIKGKAKATGRAQGAVGGAVVGYLAGGADKSKIKKVGAVGGRSGVTTATTRAIPSKKGNK